MIALGWCVTTAGAWVLTLLWLPDVALCRPLRPATAQHVPTTILCLLVLVALAGASFGGRAAGGPADLPDATRRGVIGWSIALVVLAVALGLVASTFLPSDGGPVPASEELAVVSGMLTPATPAAVTVGVMLALGRRPRATGGPGRAAVRGAVVASVLVGVVAMLVAVTTPWRCAVPL